MKTAKLDKHAQISQRLAALKADLGANDTAPPGWITTAQLAVILGMTQRNAWCQLKEWIEKGLCKVGRFKTRTQQTFRYSPHYLLDERVAKAYGIKGGKGK